MKPQVLSKTNSLLTLAFLSFSVLIVRCKNDSSDPTIPEPDPEEELTEESVADLYRNNCGGCHGQRFESFVERDWIYGNSPDEVYTSIKDGYVENGMPAYETAFTEEELRAIADYILSEIEGKTQEMLLEENPDLSGIIESQDMDFRLETMTDQIEGVPWGLEQLPNGDILVTQRDGNLYRLSTNKSLEVISGAPNVRASGQGGLLDVEIHPNYAENGFIYLSYSKIDPDNASRSTTAVARGILENTTLNQLEDIFIALPYEYTSHHFGSRLQFDRSGYLYITVGDRGNRDVFPQTLDNQIGKVHRINDDGSIPSDNPFVNENNIPGSIFAYGNRNPQGLCLHPESGEIWEGEHGPQGGDEINIIEPGNNYGWPVITYGINYNGTPITDLTEMEGMEQPIHYWTPSIAPSGMDFILGNLYNGWTDDLFVGSLKFTYLHRLEMNGNQVVGEEELLNGIGRVRDVEMGSDGYLYIAVESPGRVIRMVPEN